MSKIKSFTNRLNDLLGRLESVPPDPDEGLRRQGVNHRSIELAVEDETALQSGIQELLTYTPELPVGEGNQDGRLSWEDFLNAIDRDDQISYSYEADLVSSLPDGNDEQSMPNSLEAPLSLGEKMSASLRVSRPVGMGWSPDEVELLSTVGRQVSQHIENLRLLAQAEQYRHESEHASRRLTRQGWEEYLRASQMQGEGYIYTQNHVLPLDPHRQIEEDGLVLTQDLSVREEQFGRLVVAQPEQQGEAAQRLLASVAERLSVHVENLRLLEETERSRQQLDKRAAELETVARVSTTAASMLNPDELLQSIVDLTRNSFHLYHAQVFMLDESKQNLVLKASSGSVGQVMVAENQTVPLSDPNSLIASVANQRQGALIQDLESSHNYRRQYRLPDARSELAVPLAAGKELLGVFDVLSDIPNRFEEEDQRIYTTLAAQVAVALQNARLYAEQLRTVARLRELDHLKSAFLANMSHELRTPLNSIIGFTQVIAEGLDGPLTEDMSSDLQLIDKNGKHLLNLINDVLDMAKIEAGRLTLSPEPINLRELLQDVLDSSASLAWKKSLSLNLECGTEQDLVINLDWTRMRQVLINLVGNAIKFTEKGGVTVRISRNATTALIRICDTGIGIPADKLETIFEAFSQVDSSTTRKAGGTGLGLPISRRLVELHGGRLWAESPGESGQGSEFKLELPIG